MKKTKGFIYKIFSKDSNIEEVYIGSSKTTLGKRFGDHRYNCNNFGCPKYNQYKYKFMRQHGGFDNWDIIILEKYDDIDEFDLLLEERKYIESFEKVLNKRLPIKF